MFFHGSRHLTKLAFHQIGVLSWPNLLSNYKLHHTERLANTQLEFTILHYSDRLQQINTCLTMNSRP